MSRALTILQTVIGLGSDRVCEACGSQFICGASLKGCWCSEIKLSDEIRADLRSNYSACLCRHCLEGAAKGEEVRGKS